MSYDIDDRGSIFDVGVLCDIGSNRGGISDVYIKLSFVIVVRIEISPR